MKLREKYDMKFAKLKPRVEKLDSAKFPEGIANRLAMLPPDVLSQVLNTAVGVEIEAENATPFSANFWSIEGDNSLRNSGVEYKTKYGNRIAHLPAALDEFRAGVLMSCPQIEFTERCSVHGHLDVRWFDEDDLENLMILYTICEKFLFQVSSPYREHNIFCVPVRDSVCGCINSNIWEWLLASKKYTALNTATIRTFGTVEFRHMEGTMDKDRILNWMIVLALLKVAAQRWNNADLRHAVTRLKNESQYDGFLERTFYGWREQLPWNPKEMDAAVSDAKLFFFDREKTTCVV